MKQATTFGVRRNVGALVGRREEHTMTSIICDNRDCPSNGVGSRCNEASVTLIDLECQDARYKIPELMENQDGGMPPHSKGEQGGDE
jgi:hypothetical protein